MSFISISRLSGIASLTIALILHGNALADPIDLDAETCRGFFLLPVNLETSDVSSDQAMEPIYFVYDTGASMNVIDPDALKQLSGRTIASDRWVRLRNGTIGDLTFNALRAKTVELDHLSLALGRPVDGILAHDAFGDVLINLNYQDGVAQLRKDVLPPSDDLTVFSTKGPDPRPWITVAFGETSRHILIDSGSTANFALRNLQRYPTQSAPRSLSTSVRFNRIEHTRYARLKTSARFGNFEVETPIVSSVPKTELFGIGILKHFNITYDAKNQRLQFARASSTPIVTPPEHALGLFLRPHPNGLKIERVLPEGPSANLDLRTGDILTHMNGHPVAERGCDDNRDLQTPTITRQRNGSSKDLLIDMSKPMVE